MKRRSELADATRQRIVEAAFELHAEKGVLATSIRDIAARADVAPATVLRHFPEYDDLVAACGEIARERLPMPSAEIFDGATTLEQRVERLVVAWFDFYAARPRYYTLLADRDALPPLDSYLTEVENQQRQLCEAALEPSGAPRKAAHLLRAVIDYGVWRILAQTHATPERAARQLLTLLSPWLATLA